jgi:hypothetical protein
VIVRGGMSSQVIALNETPSSYYRKEVDHIGSKLWIYKRQLLAMTEYNRSQTVKGVRFGTCNIYE